MSTSLVPCSRATARYSSSLSTSFLASALPTSSSVFPPQTTSLSSELGSVTSLQHLPHPGSENEAYGQYVPQSQASAAAQNDLHNDTYNDTYNYHDFDSMYRRRPQLTDSSMPTGRLPDLPKYSSSTAAPTTSDTVQPLLLPHQSFNHPGSIDLNGANKTANSNCQSMEASSQNIPHTTRPPELIGIGTHGNNHLPTLYNSQDHRLSMDSAVADRHRSSERTPIIPGSQNTLGMTSLFAKGEAVASSLAAPNPTKSKRVRTGCLTCRERHLKCDSPLTRPTIGVPVPDCFNCRKGNRECKRGLRLNFIDIQVKPVPYLLPITEWNVSFKDESRLIASEYVGGARRYPRVQDAPTELTSPEIQSEIQKADHPDVYSTDVHNGASSTPFSVPGHPAAIHQSQAPQQVLHSQQHVQKSSDMQTTVAKERLEDLSTATDLAEANEDDERLSFYTGDAEVHDLGWCGRHASKSSDASSITSSMVPQGVGQSSTSSSQVEVGNSPGAASPRSLENPGAVAGTGFPNEAPEGLPTPPSETGRLMRHNAVDDRLDISGGFEDIYDNNADTPTGERDYLDSPDEMLFMQAFVQNVGVWMDVMDKEKHFSRIIPFSALKSPMLLNAFLACGVKQLTLVNQTYKDDKALFYYNTATMILSRSLQNPDRNIIECATTAVVLHVYEIMSEKPNGRASHITGARALIRECGWNANSKGIGAACFWLNISMEMLNCLAFNWPTAWDPDQWGLDLEFATDAESVKRGTNDGSKDLAIHEKSDHNPGAGAFPYRRQSMETLTEASGPTSSTAADGGDEELWVHRIFYIVAKIANFRANEPRFQEPSPHDEQVRLQNRILEWKRLKNLCDVWNRRCPRSMRPFGYLFPVPNESTSRFPNIWLVKRSAVVGRLFYHTAMVLLHQVNPIDPYDSAENRKPLHHHAHQVCGIVAHNKDQGVTAVAIRTLAVSAMVLCDSREQDEAFSLFEKMSAETGWRIERIYTELQQSWRRIMKRSDPVTVTSALPPPGMAPSRLPAPADFPPAPASLPPAEIFAASKMGPGANILAGHQFAALAPPFKPPCAPTGWTTGHHPASLAGPAPMALHAAPGPVAPSGVASGHSSPASAVSLSQRATHMMNPLFHADFRLPDHPYKAFYRPPNDANDFNAQLF